MNLGLKLNKVREHRNLTQEYLAEQLDCSIRTYAKYENGESNITVAQLERIATILEVTPEFIMNYDDSKIFNNTFNHQQGGNGFVYKIESDMESLNLFKELLKEKDIHISLLEKNIDAMQTEINNLSSKLNG